MALRRVAIGGFMHETNTFAPSKARYDDFERGWGPLPFVRGDEIFDQVGGVNVGIGGAVAYGQHMDWELCPALWCGATPSAHVEERAYERIVSELIERICALGPLDGIYLDLHGAMVAEHVDDGEGELLQRLRHAVGPDIPIAVSLDLHGNITLKMVESADVMVGYRTYPHVDMAETGRRTAVALDQIMQSGLRPAKAFKTIPFLIPISWQATEMEPCRSIYAKAEALETGDVTSLSFFPAFPAADFEGCGPTVIAYGKTESAAMRAVETIAAMVESHEDAFDGKVYAPIEGVKAAMEIAKKATKPVVIADTQDNPGAGGDANTMGMLRALVECGAQDAAIGMIYDPVAARTAHDAKEGSMVTLSIGGTSGIEGDAPFTAEFLVEKISDGRFQTTGPYYGNSQMEVGLAACLKLGGVRVVVGSHKVQMADQAMYRFVGIEPTAMKILVNKSSVHFRADFAPIAEEILICAAPGPMPVSPVSLPWTKLRKGLKLAPNGPVYA
jgi:microcystin degradation protein MlrC